LRQRRSPTTTPNPLPHPQHRLPPTRTRSSPGETLTASLAALSAIAIRA